MPAAREPWLADAPTIGSPISRTQAALLVLITLAAAWLRLSHLGSKSLWLDEGATVALARASWKHFAWVWWHGEANLQTTYFLLMRGWIHLGDSEFWLRLPSALFGIVSVPMICVLARKFMAVSPALAAAALLAFSPTHVYYSQEARSYTLAILLVLLSTYFFVCAVQRGRSKDWLLWTACGILSFYSHDFAALVLVAQTASLFFLKTRRAPWQPLLRCGAVIFLIAIPGLTYVFRASPENLHFLWMPRPSAKEFWHLAMFFGGDGVKVAVAGVLWIAGVVGILRSLRDEASDDTFWRGMLILLWLMLPPVILALISLRQPMFLQRYMIFSLPAAILLAALGMSVLYRWRIGLFLVVLLCGMSLPAILGEYSKPREDWRGAGNTVLASASPGDAVVFFPFYTRIMLDYYRDRYGANAPALHVFAPQYYAGGEDAHDLQRALDESPHRFRHVWILMTDSSTKLESLDNGAAVAEKLQSIYGPPAVRRFPDIDVLEYGR
jgi:mannosyltransferase